MTIARPPDHDHLRWMDEFGISSLKSKKLLDLGCGSGHICSTAMREGAISAIGVDVLPPVRNPEDQWQYLSLDLDGANWANNLQNDHQKKFDIILAFDILEHLSSPYHFLLACKQLMHEQSRMILTTPNIFSWERLAHPNSWSGITDPQHKILFSKYSLNFLLQRCGFQHIQITAPIRSLEFLKALSPAIGGQLRCVAG